ncbi:UTRA domain-containing protein [Effusibacillus pohliae]|uniref:UTRA domain-containing protein n=1 Tax=Effusibacillus pohliae TaxID=232270 RepID=UPI00036A3E47|nr:UTRA domain-containing protein [Effusibacillus pohliae]
MRRPSKKEEMDLTRSLYNHLRSAGYLFSQATQSIEATLLPKEVALELSVKPNRPALVLERTSYSLDNRAIEYIQSY